MDLREFRRTYPMYDGLSDQELADRLYGKFYAGKIPRETFDQRLGLQAAQPPQLNLPGPPDAMNMVPDLQQMGSDALDWIRQNPQAALDLLVQTGLTVPAVAGGSALGGPAVGAVAGAGANVLGKQASRFIGRQLGLEGSEAPDLASMETALDAGIGASGPLVSAAARPAARALVGVPERALERVRKVSNKARVARERGERATRFTEEVRRKAPPGSDTQARMRAEFDETIADDIAQRAQKTREAVTEEAARQSGRAGRLLEAGGNYGGLALAAIQGDMTAAATVFGLGHGLSAGQKAAARWLLKKDRVVRFLTNRGPAFAAKGQASAILPALAAEKWLTDTDRHHLEQLRAKPERHSALPRDARGRFVGVDHTALEQMFGKGSA